MSYHAFDCGLASCAPCANTRLNIAINTHAALIKSPVEVSEGPDGLLIQFEKGEAFSVEAAPDDALAANAAMVEVISAASAPLIAAAAAAAAETAQPEEVVVP